MQSDRRARADDARDSGTGATLPRQRLASLPPPMPLMPSKHVLAQRYQEGLHQKTTKNEIAREYLPEGQFCDNSSGSTSRKCSKICHEDDALARNCNTPGKVASGTRGARIWERHGGSGQRITSTYTTRSGYDLLRQGKHLHAKENPARLRVLRLNLGPRGRRSGGAAPRARVLLALMGDIRTAS